MILYFAYGSNMDPARLFEDRMAKAGVAWGRRIGARLDGWRLAFDKPWSKYKGAAVATIRPAPGGVVHGTLNELGSRGLDVLDSYEGVAGGHYRRLDVSVFADGRAVIATTYIAVADPVPGLRPTTAYLAHLLAGRDLLPPVYWEGLKRIETADASKVNSGTALRS